ncbi:hypothetical protein BJP37_17860 [Moorena bouillonii PNG]|uniref:Chromosome partition protein MukF C-terminal domain-containing protein n=2 Tax=Moorena TaxID=1155738 RepID=A0A1U7N3R9_9CYAN|nr:hypothetical protein BJP37_17860 [Moorena bouillonii PNG]
MKNNFIYSSDKVLSYLGIDPKKIKDIRSTLKRSHYRSAINWLTIYSPNSNSSNLEKVKGLLEAFYQFSEIEEWDIASKVISIPLNTPTNQALYNQLKTWGYYGEQIDIYQRLLGKINSDWDTICIDGLGNATRALGKWDQSREYYQQQLKKSKTIIDPDTKITALIGLANNFKFQCQYQQATNYYLQVSEIAFENSNHKGRIMALAGLGSVLTCLGQYEMALEYHQQQLAIARKNDDNLAQAEALTNLCCIYYFIKDYKQAIKYQNQSYKIAIQVENKELEAKALLYKGMISHQQWENKEAINCYEQSLELISDMGLILEKAEVLANLAISERELEKENIKKLQEKILDRFQQALSIFNKCGNSVQIANLLKEIAKTYDLTGDFDMAKKYCQEALEMKIKFNLALEKECRELQT